MGTTYSLPEEVLTTKVAQYSFRISKELYALRATSKSGLALAQRGLSSSCSFLCRHVHFRGEADPRHDEAVGRVFGAGCIRLSAHVRSPERIAALDAFVRRTNGGLFSLNLWTCNVTAEALLRMCQASPKLTKLRGPSSVAIPDSTVISISAACPDLNEVSFSHIGHSPAETYEHHFPRLNHVNLLFDGGSRPYRPTLIDAIRKTALTCRHARYLGLDGCHVTADVIEAIVGTPLGDSLQHFGEIDDDTVLEPDAILAAARGFPEFCSLKIPQGSSMPGPGFYIDLSRTTARITCLHLEDETTTDACIAAACSHLRLEWLELEYLGLLTSGIVDAITRSQSAATLSSITIEYSASDPPEPGSPLSAADVLRLLQGCPNLRGLGWSLREYDSDRAGLDRVLCQGIVDLLKDRGATVEACDFDELQLGFGMVDDDFIIHSWPTVKRVSTSSNLTRYRRTPPARRAPASRARPSSPRGASRRNRRSRSRPSSPAPSARARSPRGPSRGTRT